MSLTGISLGLSALGLTGVVHILRGRLKNSIQLSSCCINGSNILGLMRLLQLIECSLNGLLLIGRQLIAELLQLLFGLENQTVGSIQFRSEERRVGKECRSRGVAEPLKKIYWR